MTPPALAPPQAIRPGPTPTQMNPAPSLNKGQLAACV